MSVSVCIIATKAPYAGQAAHDTLAVALAAAACTLPTGFLLMGDGVYQLFAEQAPAALTGKPLTALLRALPLYGISQVHVDTASLAARGLDQDRLQPPWLPVEPQALPAFLQQYDHVLSC